MNGFERWLDGQPESTLKSWYWMTWLVGSLVTMLGYACVIPIRIATAVGGICFLLGYLSLTGLYLKRNPVKGSQKQIPLLYSISAIVLLLAVISPIWLNFIQ